MSDRISSDYIDETHDGAMKFGALGGLPHLVVDVVESALFSDG